jgi:hypothetical protein
MITHGSDTDASLVVFIDKLELCILGIPEALALLTQASKAKCRQPEYIVLRNRVFWEAIMYYNQTYPRSMTVLTNIRKMLNSFYHLSYDEFVEDLQALIQDCDRYKRKAIVAQNENKFVLARLGKLREEIIRQSTGFGTNSDLARRSARTKADAGAGLGMSVVAGAGLGFLVGGPIGALAVGSVLSSSSMLLLQSSSLDMSYAADWNSAAMATAALLDSLTKVDGIVDSIAKFLGMMASELEDIETAGKNQIDARRYLRYFQRKHDEAVGMCDAFMKTQSALQSAFEDEADEVDNSLRLEWLRERRNVVGY